MLLSHSTLLMIVKPTPAGPIFAKLLLSDNAAKAPESEMVRSAENAPLSMIKKNVDTANIWFPLPDNCKTAVLDGRSQIIMAEFKLRSLFTALFILLGFAAASAQADDGRRIIVPVIFHIIYTDTLPDNGISEKVRNSNDGNSTTRLPKEKILAELKDLDQDFQQTNPDIGDVISEYKPVIGNPKIHFFLRQIIYVQTTLDQIHQFTNTDKLHELSLSQQRDSCLNVYISTLRVKGKGSEGVTNVPSDHVNLADDAVNLNYSWVGLHYRLLSHEVGHWLGLWHVNAVEQITVDHITDIPVQTELTEIQCVQCTRPGVKVIRRQRNQFSKPNTNNYMDYSGCRRMFSIQQSNYMRDMIMRLRKDIYDSSTIPAKL